MRATVNAKKLARMITLAEGFVGKKSSNPLLENYNLFVYDNKLYLNVYNLHAQNSFLQLWCDAFNCENGKVAVHYKDMQSFKKLKKGDVIIEVDEGHTNNPVKITIDGVCKRIKVYDYWDNPLEPLTGLKDKEIEISSADSEKFKGCLLACSKDITREELTGAIIRNGNLVSTDGHRLHKFELSSNETIDGIVPSLLLKFMSTNTGILSYWKAERKDNYFIYGGDDFIMYYAEIRGLYPNFSRVFPNRWEGKTIISKTRLKEIIKQTVEGYKNALIIFRTYHIDGKDEYCIEGKPIKTTESWFSKNKIDCGVSDWPAAVAVNAKYALDALESVQDESIMFAWIDEDSPLWLGSSKYDNDWVQRPKDGAIIMPMRF